MVLLNSNRVWQGGTITNLQTTQLASAFGVSDRGVILGRQSVEATNPSGGIYSYQVACLWADKNSAPVAIAPHNNVYPYPGNFDPEISQYNSFIAYSRTIGEINNDTLASYWMEGGGLRAPLHYTLPQWINQLGDNEIVYGTKVENQKTFGLVRHNSNSLPEFEGQPISARAINGDSVVCRLGKSALLYDGTQWVESKTYNIALDVAADGTAIGWNSAFLRAPVCLNGTWFPISRVAPDQSYSWLQENHGHTDISTKGWIIGDYEEDNTVLPYLMLPLRVEGNYTPTDHEAAGVDDFSIGCTGLSIPFELSSMADRIWIMAPEGGGLNTVTLRAPLSVDSALTLTADGAVKFNGNDELELENEVNTFTVAATAGQASGIDMKLKLRLGPSESASTPIGLKIMKRRTVRVAIHPVALKQNGAAAIYPQTIANNALATRQAAQAQFKDRLDRIYGPQTNTYFDVTVLPAVETDFDLGTQGEIEISPSLASTPELDLVCTNPLSDSGAAEIDVWLVGGVDLKMNGIVYQGMKIGGNIVNTQRQTPYVILHGGGGNQGQVLAHEIGHIMFGPGHPGDKLTASIADLPGTDASKRLMASGINFNPNRVGKMLVKREWDAVDVWLKITGVQ